MWVHCRGDGFVTDPDIIKSLHLDDPRPFFKELLTKTYRKRTVLSPHYYGMTVTNNTYTGHQLWEKFTQSWGRLQVRGEDGWGRGRKAGRGATHTGRLIQASLHANIVEEWRRRRRRAWPAVTHHPQWASAAQLHPAALTPRSSCVCVHVVSGYLFVVLCTTLVPADHRVLS